MIDIYEIYAHIRAYWFDYGKVQEITLRWVESAYYTSAHFNNEAALQSLLDIVGDKTNV